MSSTPVFVGTVRNAVAQIQNSDSTNLITLIAGGAAGTKVEAITISSTDTAARDVQLIATKGAVDYVLGVATIPITAGNATGVPSVDLLANIPGLKEDAEGKKHLLIDVSVTLKIKVLVAVTAAKVVQAFVVAGDI